MWDLPHNTHRHFIEELSGTHASTMLICRFINFIKSIKKSSKRAVQFLYQKVKNNLNTVTGRNVQFVVETTGSRNIEDINTNQVKKNMKFCEVDPSESWKANFIREVVNLKQNVLFLDDETEVVFENQDLDYIVEYLATS